MKRIREYYEKPFAQKFDHLGEMDQFLEGHNFPKLAQEKII